MAKICATVLKASLPKPTDIRNAAPLTQDQIKFAALDAYVSMVIFESLIDCPSVHKKISKKHTCFAVYKFMQGLSAFVSMRKGFTTG